MQWHLSKEQMYLHLACSLNNEFLLFIANIKLNITLHPLVRNNGKYRNPILTIFTNKTRIIIQVACEKAIDSSSHILHGIHLTTSLLLQQHFLAFKASNHVDSTDKMWIWKLDLHYNVLCLLNKTLIPSHTLYSLICPVLEAASMYFGKH